MREQVTSWVHACQDWLKQYEDAQDDTCLDQLVESGSHLPFTLVQYKHAVDLYEKRIT